MTIFTKKIAAGSRVLEVRKTHPTVSAFNEAVYRPILAKTYGDPNRDLFNLMHVESDEQGNVKLDSDGKPSIVYDLEKLKDTSSLDTITRANAINGFIDIAKNLVSAQGFAFTWRGTKTSADDLDLAFMDYLEDEDGLWASAKAAIAELDRPNGVNGAAPQQLTEAEKDDPLSRRVVANG